MTETLPQGALVRVRAIPGSDPWSSVRLGVSPGTQEPGHGGHRPRRSAATLAYACSRIFSRRSMTRCRVSASSRRSTSSSGDRALSACAAVAAASRRLRPAARRERRDRRPGDRNRRRAPRAIRPRGRARIEAARAKTRIAAARRCAAASPVDFGLRGPAKPGHRLGRRTGAMEQLGRDPTATELPTD